LQLVYTASFEQWGVTGVAATYLIRSSYATAPEHGENWKSTLVSNARGFEAWTA
jgi:hypothetical protein